MLKYLFLFLSFNLFSQYNPKSLIKENVSIKIYTYQQKGETKASAMPQLRADSELLPYARRFEYLLINDSEIHLPEKANERKVVWNLYPDTNALKSRYLKKFSNDKVLGEYFSVAYSHVQTTDQKGKMTVSEGELLEVASKFFFCNRVLPDTSVQAHVCVGLNGVAEANWKRDYTLIEAFCYEAIYTSIDQDNSELWSEFITNKKRSAENYRAKIESLDDYLHSVKIDLFETMKNSETLRKCLLDHYKKNEGNLAFRLK